MKSYSCQVVEQPRTRRSWRLQPLFDAWAGTVGTHLYPGTAYLCAERSVAFPEGHVSLAQFEHLHSADHQRERPGYSPRLYAVTLAGCQLAWVYRWSNDDPANGFLGEHGGCDPRRLLEVVAPVHIRDAFRVSQLSLSFVAEVGG